MFFAYFVDQKLGQQKGEKRNPLFGAYIIISNSMIPNINVYDAVLTVRVQTEQIHVDDIITFLSKEIETRGTPITHRVIGIVYDSEDNTKVLGYRTKGDHNNTADFALIRPEEVLGKVYLRVPKLGYIQTIMTKPIGWILLVVIPCLCIIMSDVLKLIRKNNSKNQDSSSKQDVPKQNFNQEVISMSPVSVLESTEVEDLKNISLKNLDNENETSEGITDDIL